MKLFTTILLILSIIGAQNTGTNKALVSQYPHKCDGFSNNSVVVSWSHAVNEKHGLENKLRRRSNKYDLFEASEVSKDVYH